MQVLYRQINARADSRVNEKFTFAVYEGRISLALKMYDY